MYESYWQVDCKPFDNATDARFYFPDEAHQGALLKLRYAIENRRGAVLLAGAGGLGKTMLVQTLASQLPENIQPLVHVVFPQMPPDQLLAFLAEEFQAEPFIGEELPPLQQSIRRLRDALTKNAEAGRHALLVIDEAQLLEENGTLETMRLLLNFEYQSQPMLTLLLVGQPAILPALDRMPQLDGRMATKCLLRPFTSEETAGYVNHRLTAANAKQPIFDPSAMEALHGLSRGNPRQINRLCDLALLIGFAEEQTTLGAEQIEAVSDELLTVVPE